jgi:type I restriction enzyme S subunit
MSAFELLVSDHLDLWTSVIKRKSGVGRGSSKKFELFGIKKLRELILELAVRGLLVPQDTSEEPVGVLLKKTAAEKARLAKLGKIKKEKLLPLIAKEDEPFDLPLGWVWQHLADVFYSIPVSKNKVKTSEMSEQGKHPVVDQGQSFVAGYVDNDELVISIPGPVIVFGDHTSAVKYIDFNFVAGADGVKILRPICCDERYFFLVCKTLPVEGRGYGRHYSRLVDNLFPLPPLSEQARIVAKVEELMELCDCLEEQTEASLSAHQTLVEVLLEALNHAADHNQLSIAWQRIATHFDILFVTESSIEQLKQTILQLAVMGKLVSQADEDESASDLLKKLAVEKSKLVKQGKGKKEKLPLPIPAGEKPFELPGSWAWSRIQSATLSSEYGISAQTFEMSEGVPILKMGDIQAGKVILGGQKKASHDFDGISGLMLEYGDLLYNRTNSAELVGKTGMFNGPSNAFSFASYLIRIRCDKNFVLPEFLNLCMNTPLFRKTQIEPHLKQQCGQANVNGTIMKNMIVPVAPVAEQRRIVACVDELMAMCEQMISRLRQTHAIQLHLAEAMVEQMVTR